MEDFGGFIRGKCMGFSVDIVNLYKNLSENKKEYVLSKQVLRSGTSILKGGRQDFHIILLFPKIRSRTGR